MTETTIREALAAQALHDIDELLTRLESLDTRVADSIGASIESAIKVALNPTLYDTERRIKQITTSEVAVLTETTRQICRELRTELMKPHVQVIADSLSGKVISLFLLIATAGILAGGVGGLITSLLLR